MYKLPGGGAPPPALLARLTPRSVQGDLTRGLLNNLFAGVWAVMPIGITGFFMPSGIGRGVMPNLITSCYIYPLYFIGIGTAVYLFYRVSPRVSPRGEPTVWGLIGGLKLIIK